MIHRESDSSPRMSGDGALEIKNPRRILAVSLEDATQHLTRVVQGMVQALHYYPTPRFIESDIMGHAVSP